MLFKQISYLLLSIIFYTGCSAVYKTQGQYFLETKQYKAGLEAFEKNVQNYPDDANVNYYLGRFYLAENQPEVSIRYLKRSSQLNPTNADTYFWSGVAYSQIKQPKLERRQYLKALSLDTQHLQARIYLAHNQFEKKEFTAALENYNMVLLIQPNHPDALYNRTVILKRLGKKSQERDALKQYLAAYPSGAFAIQAVFRLNELGDFGYRNYQIGNRTVTLGAIVFEPYTAEIHKISRPSLDVLGGILKNNRRISLNIIAYQKNNRKLAKAKAQSIKIYLLNNFSDIKPDRLKLSWFGIPETIKSPRKKKFKSDESINFFTS
jgi:tetratricopeptide (TPR) repeat protein